MSFIETLLLYKIRPFEASLVSIDRSPSDRLDRQYSHHQNEFLRRIA